MPETARPLWQGVKYKRKPKKQERICKQNEYNIIHRYKRRVVGVGVRKWEVAVRKSSGLQPVFVLSLTRLYFEHWKQSTFQQGYPWLTFPCVNIWQREQLVRSRITIHFLIRFIPDVHGGLDQNSYGEEPSLLKALDWTHWTREGYHSYFLHAYIMEIRCITNRKITVSLSRFNLGLQFLCSYSRITSVKIRKNFDTKTMKPLAWYVFWTAQLELKSFQPTNRKLVSICTHRL
jgi:hypothetical protein